MPQDLSKNSNFLDPRKLFWIGTMLLLLGGALLLFLLLPALKQEFRYWYKTTFEARDNSREEGRVLEPSQEETMKVADTQFGILIPKIEANAKVLQDIDWEKPTVYQEALRHGVAHAKGTALPGAAGNVFIFAHSGVDFSEAARYNAVFYLMNKLEQGDEITIFYEGKEYRYQVTGSKKVASDAVEYLEQDKSKKTLTLMTCWPAGTTLKRLIVEAELLEQ